MIGPGAGSRRETAARETGGVFLRFIGRCYAKIHAMSQDRKALDGTAFGTMLVLSMVWGIQQVPIKLTAPEVSLLMQGGIRSVVATLLVFLWARWQGAALFGRDGTLPAGIAAGLLFAFEFVFIYFGLGHTAASRM